MILPGSTSQAFGAALADAVDAPLGAVEYERFADDEVLTRVTNLPTDADDPRAGPGDEAVDTVGGDRAVVVCATTSDRAHVECLQLQEVAARHFERVVTVLPYMGYARQDQAFRPSEPVSARAVARALSTHTDHVLLVEPHEPAVGEFFDVPCTAVSAAPRLARALPDLSGTSPLFLAPDAAAVDLARAVRDAHGAGTVDYFHKTRDPDTGDVTIEPHDTAATDRTVVVVDDIIATGSTMSGAVAALDAPARVIAACVHPVLTGAAQTRLTRAGVDRVVGTDTVERAVSAVSAAPAVAAALD